MTLALFMAFLVLLVLGFPVAFSLGISSFVYLFIKDINLIVLPQKMFSGIDSFVLLCVPGFVLAGNLMNTGGITQKIIKFSNILMGRIRGGLSIANIVASMIFAGISGTAVGEATSLGGILIPAMKKEGYDTDFSCAVSASASTMGPIIPPSLPMVIAGTMTGLSVSKLFVAGAIPGIMIGVGLMIVAYYISVKRGYPKGENHSLKEIFKAFLDAFWALLMTIIILFGIIGGVFTPTEASIVAVLYALFAGFFIYKELSIKDLPKVLLESAITTAGIIVLVGFANIFAWILASEKIPQLVAAGMLSITQNKYLLLLLINILLLIVGCFMETNAAILILFPVLLKVATSVGVDPIQFTIVVVLNLVIGLLTPPVGVCLFVASSIGKTSMSKVTKALLPFLGVCLTVLMLVTYVPQVTLFLVHIVFK